MQACIHKVLALACRLLSSSCLCCKDCVLSLLVRLQENSCCNTVSLWFKWCMHCCSVQCRKLLCERAVVIYFESVMCLVLWLLALHELHVDLAGSFSALGRLCNIAFPGAMDSYIQVLHATRCSNQISKHSPCQRLLQMCIGRLCRFASGLVIAVLCLLALQGLHVQLRNMIILPWLCHAMKPRQCDRMTNLTGVSSCQRYAM